ncbi:MAG: cysteine--tRNA ligase [Eubacteriales bacterium]|jgi:cysteinyl-tRNA synthetase|nr:cysteine--tRNA ligase [Clostridiales bacterium]
MKLYNTLTRSKEEFAPLKDNTARIYTCGPTVYNFAHIGNLRTYLFMDILRRSLTACGFKLYHVMNITDVGHLVSDADEGEDKMVKAAREQRKSPWEIAEFYTRAFMRDIERLNIGKPEVIARATEHIDDMIDFVQKLVERERAYETSDGIYYDIGKFPEYGMLSGIKLDEQQAGARVEVNPEKRHPADFTVWIKAPKEHIMQWESPWGMGYPGWHIECSAMGLKYLGEYFDIHTGGVDHIPIHHENEIAQTCGLFGHPAAKFWLHGEFMLVDGGKMSKSLGNIYTIDDLVERGYDPLDFRYFCLNAHYRQKLNFTFSGLDSAKKSLANLRTAVASHKDGDANPDLDGYMREFYDAVGDDLNIPRALGVLWNMVRGEQKSAAVYNAALEMDKVFGLDLHREPEKQPEDDFTPEERAEIEAMIAARTAAKKAKNYAEADRIRAELASRGIVLTDTKEGTTYARA